MGGNGIEAMIQRINELYHKSQAEGLTAEEKAEQAKLRSAYVANVRRNLKSQLDNISIVEKDGTITNLGEKHEREEKRELRKQILALRDAMPMDEREEKSHRIMRALISMPLYDQSDSILTYVNYQSEVNTTDLVNKALSDGKRVFAPRVSGETMEFYRLAGTEDLREGYKGIREPVSERIFDADADTGHTLMLMPGAVFDEKCHRIGYGKGFYDRYLKCILERGISVYTLALSYECQVLPEIPFEKHDIRPQAVLTEMQFRTCSDRTN